MSEFYGLENAAKHIGSPEEYLEFVYDFDFSYQIDSFYLGRFGGKWFVIEAHGCSCWGGEYDVTSGPHDNLDGVREYVKGEYATNDTEYYKAFHDAWNEALEKAAQAA